MRRDRLEGAGPVRGRLEGAYENDAAVPLLSPHTSAIGRVAGTTAAGGERAHGAGERSSVPVAACGGNVPVSLRPFDSIQVRAAPF
jgi:hypothetical protein